MEKHNTITYHLTKIKYSDIQSESSSESLMEAMSTSISSQSLTFSSQPFDLESYSQISEFPLSKSFSKNLQKQISKADPETLQSILTQLSPYMPDLMVDLYGNYVCQTIFHTCSAEQRFWLLQLLKGHLEKISYSPRGTHALQNLISLASSKKEENFYMEEFKGKIFSMSKDINASHVVQRLICSLNFGFFVSNEIRGKVKDLATDKFGVCLLKKCVNNQEIMNEVIENSLFLMQHPFGNYAVQYIIEGWGDEVAYELYSVIRGKVTQLCLQKFSSNVIEKAVCSEMLRDLIVKEIFIEDKLKVLLMNQYGCYVLRTFAKYCEKCKKKEALRIVEKCSVSNNYPKLRPLWVQITQDLEIN